METNYLIIMDSSDGTLIKIKLTEDEKQHIDDYSDMEAFIQAELEEKYEFNLGNFCTWMALSELNEISYNMED